MKRYVLFLLAFVAGAASAHEPSRALLNLAVDGAEVHGQWDIALRDLEDAVGLDADGDYVLSWGEVRARSAEIVAYALPRLDVAAADGSPCALEGRLAGIETHGGAAFAALALTGTCAAAPSVLRVNYHLLFDVDAAHRGVVTIDGIAGSAAAVMSADARMQVVDLTAGSAWATVQRFVVEGMHHIWEGYDHLAFVVLLLLPIALGVARREPALGARAVVEVVRVVTAFTLAHSITLALAAFDVVALPTRAVELVIAGSVLLAAVWNLVPGAPRLGAKLAFVFGLVHGFGFANALGDLTTGASSALLYALGGFNLGVEFGQLAVVTAVLPLLLLIRQAALWPRAVHAAVSATCAAVALGWVVERWA